MLKLAFRVIGNARTDQHQPRDPTGSGIIGSRSERSRIPSSFSHQPGTGRMCGLVGGLAELDACSGSAVFCGLKLCWQDSGSVYTARRRRGILQAVKSILIFRRSVCNNMNRPSQTGSIVPVMITCTALRSIPGYFDTLFI